MNKEYHNGTKVLSLNYCLMNWCTVHLHTFARIHLLAYICLHTFACIYLLV
jgi:hypothetical protein